ncbi:MAG: penicillin-binding protein 1C [Methyloceanibacter sp.]|jgi:penicillin-binding protein 1C|uniref:penicillin-binding protein 1C n=1 Tax=Methyloceanibacter sp. TaxID=1965321 RepID=UPI003C49B6C7
MARRDRREPRRRLTYAAIGLLWCVAIVAGALVGLADTFGAAPLGKSLSYSKTVLGGDGHLLRAYLAPDGRWRLPASRTDVDPRFLDALLAYEDKRFYDHSGVDPVAMMRAAYQLLTRGEIVSGGSTISMQVARLLEPRRKRSLYAKYRQMVRAVQLERALSKDDILSLYLTLAPYGGNLEGIRAASFAYFGKEPRRLTLGETALLVALPQSPEYRRPDRHPERARAARNRVLDRISGNGIFSAQELEAAKAELVPSERKPMPLVAPHAADDANAAFSDQSIIKLTIRARLQRRLERLARDRAAALGDVMSAAIVVVEHETGRILARVGTPDYFDVDRAGQVDLTRAVRSPGSTLKPFIYGIGFEDGLVHPQSLIDDRPIRFGDYAPENFDQTFQGTVTVRRALQLSLNVPAVSLLDAVGPSRLLARLGEAGVRLKLPAHETAGLALGLGGIGIRLVDLTALYAGLARQGTVAPFYEQEADPRRPAQRLMEPVAAWYVGDVLRGAPPPPNALGGRIAFKTGTSYGYRDAWAVGFDGKYTVGVWTGRPDGAPIPGLLGRTAAAPILFDVFARLTGQPKPLAPAPEGVLTARTAQLPPPLRHFAGRYTAAATGTPDVRILFPPNDAAVALQSSGAAIDPIAIKIAGGTAPLNILVDGMPLQTVRGAGTVFFAPVGPGFVRLTVTDALGAADSVTVRLQP